MLDKHFMYSKYVNFFEKNVERLIAACITNKPLIKKVYILSHEAREINDFIRMRNMREKKNKRSNSQRTE